VYVIFEKFRTCLELLPTLDTQPGQFSCDKRTAKEPAALPSNEAEVQDVTVALGCPVSRTGAVTRCVVTGSSGKIGLTQHADEIDENEARVLGTESNSAHGVLGEHTHPAQCGTAG